MAPNTQQRKKSTRKAPTMSTEEVEAAQAASLLEEAMASFRLPQPAASTDKHEAATSDAPWVQALEPAMEAVQPSTAEAVEAVAPSPADAQAEAPGTGDGDAVAKQSFVSKEEEADQEEADEEEVAAAEAARRKEAEEVAVCEAAAALGYDSVAVARLLRTLSGIAPRPPHLGPGALLDSVASGAIAPLRGSWVVELEARGGRLARRQELPPEAFFSAAELRRLVEALGDDYGLLFVALSYRWLTKDHPDPDAFHLAIIAAVARLYMKEADDFGYPRVSSPLAHAFKAKGLGVPDFALFWDFASLMQAERSANEAKLFLPGLRASNVWYGHELSVCWMQTELPSGFAEQMKAAGLALSYYESGWCFVEAAISAGLKLGTRRLDLGKRTKDAMEYAGGHYSVAGWPASHTLEGSCAAARLPPLLPDEVKRRLELEKTFTSAADVGVVDKLYRSFFEGATRFATHLNFSRLAWTDQEAQQLTDVLPRFTSLAVLDLSSNQLEATGAKAVAKYVAVNTALKHLDLSCNALCGIDEDGDGTYDPSGIQAFAAALGSGSTALNKLDTRGNNIFGEAAQQLSSAVLTSASIEVFSVVPIKELRADSLTELNLRAQSLGPTEAMVLAALIKGSTALKSINLRVNSLGTEGWCAIFHALRDNKENKIESWDLYGEGINPEIIKPLAEYISVSTTITELNLGYNRIGPTGLKAIAEALQIGTTTLTSLSLIANSIGPDGAKALAGALASGRSTLTACKLIQNNLDVDSATMLAKIGTEKRIMLSGMKRDQTEVNFRNFRGQVLNPADGILIASDLPFMTTLKKLDLDGFELNIEQLKGVDPVDSINLSAEGLGPASGIVIAKCIELNTTLTDLNLEYNQLGVEGGKAIAEALKLNTGLTVIDLQFNDLDDDTKRALTAAAKQRCAAPLDLKL